MTRQEVVRSSWDPEQEGWDEDGHEDLVRCVREVVAGWKLTKTAAKQPSTLLLPVIFRFASAPAQPRQVPVPEHWLHP